MLLKNAKHKLSVILFDLGFTLINFDGDFHRAMKESYAALANSLKRSGCSINVQEFAQKFNEVVSEYYRTRAMDLIERPVEESLQKTLDSFSIGPLPRKVLEDAIKAMYTYTESWWKIEPDTHETLSKLKKMGYRLALISNASNSPDLNRLIDNHKLRKYFELVVISAEQGIRKPDPRIFTRTLDKLGVQPKYAVMVGDTLPADVLGARLAGVTSIWVTRRANRPENSEVQDSIKPDYTIHDLASLIDVIEHIDKTLS